MAKAKISEWSTTAGNNTEIDGVPLGEGVMVPSNVNNALREIMSQVAELFGGTSGDAWPISAGGTGATSAAGARAALGITATATATETTSGVMRIATAAELTAGTLDNVALTPKKATEWQPATATPDTVADKVLFLDATDSKVKQGSFPSSNVIVDRAYADYTTNADLSTTIPADDTIPQSTEGTQILSVSITPKSTTNRLRVSFEGQVVHSTAGTNIGVAVFLNSEASARDARFVTIQSNGYAQNLACRTEFVPGATSSQTIAVRIGASSGTMRMNGGTSSRVFGGASRATLLVEEITA